MKYVSRSGAHVYLCGFMGGGKSTVGPMLAEQLALPFIDLDEVCAQLSGESVEEYLRREGEDAFRQLEIRGLDQVAVAEPAVVALGGGTLLDPQNQNVVKRTGTLIYLKSDLSVLASRLAGSQTKRPLLAGVSGEEVPESQLEALFRAREPGYLEAEIQVSTDGKTADEVVQAILEELSK